MKIKVINLDRRPDRFANFTKEMVKNGITDFEKFSAIDGRSLTANPEITEKFANNTFKWRRGIIGACLSHTAIWRELVESDEEYYLIFEDDIRIDETWSKYFPMVEERCNEKEYGCVLLGFHTAIYFRDHPFFVGDKSKFNIYPTIQKNHIIGGLFGYIIHRNFAKKLLDKIDANGYTDPIDTFLMKERDIYSTCPTLVYSDFMTYKNKVDSDIQYDLASLHDDYTFFSELDSPHNDLNWVRITTFPQLKKAADEQEGCVAFNTYGFLKSKICNPKDFIKLPGCNSKIHGIYVKNSELEKFK